MKRGLIDWIYTSQSYDNLLVLYVQNQPLQKQLPTMVTHTVFLMSFHQSPSQRSNFAIFIPSTHDLKIGTLINVMGALMIGFFPEFKKDYAPDIDEQPHSRI